MSDALIKAIHPKIGTYFHVHLVADSTGETLNALAKAFKVSPVESATRCTWK